MTSLVYLWISNFYNPFESTNGRWAVGSAQCKISMKEMNIYKTNFKKDRNEKLSLRTDNDSLKTLCLLAAKAIQIWRLKRRRSFTTYKSYRCLFKYCSSVVFHRSIWSNSMLVRPNRAHVARMSKDKSAFWKSYSPMQSRGFIASAFGQRVWMSFPAVRRGERRLLVRSDVVLWVGEIDAIWLEAQNTAILEMVALVAELFVSDGKLEGT